MPLTPLGVKRPDDIGALPESWRHYFELLEAALLNRQTVGEPAPPPKVGLLGWSVQTWIAVASFTGMILVSVFSVGARWNGVDALMDRMSKLETRFDAERSTADAQYARRDLIDLRLQTLSGQINELQVDIKSILQVRGK